MGAMSALQTLLDQPCFWMQWAAVAPPVLLHRMGQLAMKQAECDQDLLDSLLFAASHVWPSVAPWPSCQGYHQQLDTPGWGQGSGMDPWSQGLQQGAVPHLQGFAAAEASINALLADHDDDDSDDGAVSCAPENALVTELVEAAKEAKVLVREAKQHIEDMPAEDTWLKRLKRILVHISTPELEAAALDLEWIGENPHGDESVEHRAAQALEHVDHVTQHLKRILVHISTPECEAAAPDLEWIVDLFSDWEHVDHMMQRHEHPSLTLAQRRVQDTLLLACCRLMNPNELQEKGMPVKLGLRLNKAFRRDVALDHDLWARLGKAKYHLFTQGKKWGKRKPKLAKRPPAKKAEAQDAAGAFDLETVMEEEEEEEVTNCLSLGDLAEGLTVLDLSGTCGGFAISAALGRATRTTVVEQAGTAKQTCRQNYIMNRISFANEFAAASSHHSVIAVDTWEFLRDAAIRGDQFDIVVFRLQGHPVNRLKHRQMNSWVFSVLRDGGLLVAYPCSSEFEVEAVLNAGRLAQRSLWKEVEDVILENQHVQKGFPQGAYMQEGIQTRACYFRVRSMPR